MLSTKVSSVIPLKNMNLLVFFENGVIKKFDTKPIIKDSPEFQVLENEDIFNLVKVKPGGYGISWNSELDCSEGDLWENGVEIPLDTDDFTSYIKYNTLVSSEATELLNCSRQNLDSYIRRGRLKPIKESQRSKLFLKTDILNLKQ